LELFANSNGEVDLGTECFAPRNQIVHYVSYSNAVIVIRVEHGSRVTYKAMQVSDFNKEYMKGNTDIANYTLSVTLN